MCTVKHSMKTRKLDSLANHISKKVPSELNYRNGDTILRSLPLRREYEHIGAVNPSVSGTVEEENQHDDIEGQIQSMIEQVTTGTDLSFPRHVYVGEEVHACSDTDDDVEDGQGHHEAEMYSDCLAYHLETGLNLVNFIFKLIGIN